MTSAGGSVQPARPRADLVAPSPLVAAIGLFVLPLIWWAPISIAALLAASGFGLLLLRYWLAPVQASASPRATPIPAAPWLLLAGAAIAVTAFILDPSASLRIAGAAFIVSRALLLFPAARTSLSWLACAHVAASLLSGIAIGAGAALSVVLISIAALLCDLARWSRMDVARGGAAVVEAPQTNVVDVAEVDAGTNETTAATTTASTDVARETEAAGAAIPTTDGAATVASPRDRDDAIDIVRGAAALAATFVAGLLLIVQTPSAPLATRAVAPAADAPSEAEIDAEWRARFPWAFPDLEQTEDAQRLSAECMRADYYDRLDLHALLEHLHQDAGGWTSVAAQFERPPVELAPADVASAAFGAPCNNDARLRVMDGARIAVSDGLGFVVGEEQVVVGAVHQLSTPRGPLLLARAWSNESGIVLLIADSVADDPRIIAISNRSAFDRGGRLFAVEGGGAQLWYGALSEDAHSASAVDIIDVSGEIPVNTGQIVAWGASTCGQTLGDPLYPAEENCVERPAWAYWLVEARYSSDAHDRIDVIWNVRRQFGEPGEPATYEEPFDELMHGAYERRADGWRLTRLTGPELEGLQAQLTPMGSSRVLQQ